MAPVKKRKANAANCPPEVSPGLILRLGPLTQKKKSVIEILDELDDIHRTSAEDEDGEEDSDDEEVDEEEGDEGDEGEDDVNDDDTEGEDDDEVALPATPKSLKRKRTIIEGGCTTRYPTILLTICQCQRKTFSLLKLHTSC
jgi:hypothetical protein